MLTWSELGKVYTEYFVQFFFLQIHICTFLFFINAHDFTILTNLNKNISH